jgi:hypothetical protein
MRSKRTLSLIRVFLNKSQLGRVYFSVMPGKGRNANLTIADYTSKWIVDAGHHTRSMPYAR